MADEAEVEEVRKVKLTQTVDSTPHSCTFVLHEEDHTLGNSLRYVLNRNPKVSFCGYSIPHPLEAKLNLHVQVTEGTTGPKALKKALKDLSQVCRHVEATFDAALMDCPLQPSE